MSPNESQESLSPQVVGEWLKDLAAHPVDPSELERSSAFDPTNPRMNPEAAVNLSENGVPEWWPARHPDYQDGEKLTPDQRAKWFQGFLAGQLKPLSVLLHRMPPNERRLRLAESLLLILSDFESGELPIPD